MNRLNTRLNFLIRGLQPAPEDIGLRCIRLLFGRNIANETYNRAFPVVGPQIWNDLPAEVTSAESLTTFRQRLKTHLFSKSFPGYLLDID